MRLPAIERRSTIPCWCALCTLAAAGGWTVPVTLASSEPPLPESASYDEDILPAKAPLLGLRATQLDLELEGEYQYRRVRSHRDRREDTRQVNRDARFEQTVSLRLDGHLVDPRVIRWEGGLRLGLSQEYARETWDGVRRSDYDSGTLIEYDIRLDFFPDQPVGGQAYALRSRDRIPRRFLPSLIEERNEAGASAYWQQGKWSGELALDWSDIQRSGNKATRDDEDLETLRLTFDNRWEISDRQQLRITFDHEREESDYEGSLTDFDTVRDQVRIEHDLAFGPQDRHLLSSYFRYSDERGDLARDEIEAVTRLSLRHSDRWQTAYRYSGYGVDQDEVEVVRHKGDFQALYKPDDRWRVSFDAFALRETVDSDLETHQYGGGLDVSFRTPTDHGEFRANASFQADQRRTVGDAGQGRVLGEVHVLDPVRASYLREPDIIRHTIRAYNAQRTRIYIEGRDYYVIALGHITSVYRILSGSMVEDEPISFDYQYVIRAGSRVDTYRTDLRLEHAFRCGLTPYYALDVRRQDASGSRGVPVYADNTERHRLGTRWDSSTWSAGAELELVHDSVEPFDAFHADLRVPVLRNPDHELDSGVRFSTYDFDGDRSRRVHWFEVDAMSRMRLSPYLSGTLKTAYRWEDNSLDGLTEGIDVECGLQYQRGALRVEFIMEYDALDIDQSSERGFGVWLNVRRDLTHLLASGARN